MVNFQLPPPPPVPEGQLQELASYYRQLVEYHQKAAAIAAGRLAHVEALLQPSEGLAWSVEVDYQLQEPEAAIESLPASEEAVISQEESRSEVQAMGDLELIERLGSLLEANRGKLLQADFIVREIFGKLPVEELAEAKERIGRLLAWGEAKQQWHSVPDAPGCWTQDLKSIPGFSEAETNGGKPRRFSQPTLLASSKRLQEYQTVQAAIKACLEAHYPKSLTANQIFDWFYPEGAPSDQDRTALYRAIQQQLSGGEPQHWQRAKLGRYIAR